ncbi:glycosyltransferase family 2 protein [Halomonas ramblicola]|uniref:glycosyltransferase family 2 protein n=1 Tax=Halomonas ramblicola TaxID=747349 RepID=UPI0025B61726|nr:glycosyltransferase family 2 protein [Halomonas ramblicola]MDN3521806.1 glycosyltransferase family 2 protein [Halomonas ramblicola]
MADAHPCALVPVYNHPATIAEVCYTLDALGLPVVLVDDGSDDACRRVLDRLADQGHRLVRLAENRGKGVAVRAGLREAERLGYSHALQVDADGQHRGEDLPAFLEALRESPRALLAGYPRYDASVPRIRFYGRYATHVWVWINTLSRQIRDTMCGVRLYPVAPLNRLLERHPCGDRMTFDTEVLVRWHWAGGALRNLPVRVHYPADGISHFAPWRDNLQISAMHTRLFFGMLRRLPRLLGRRGQRP